MILFCFTTFYKSHLFLLQNIPINLLKQFYY